MKNRSNSPLIDIINPIRKELLKCDSFNITIDGELIEEITEIFNNYLPEFDLEIKSINKEYQLVITNKI